MGSTSGQVVFIARAGSAAFRRCAEVLDRRSIPWSRFASHEKFLEAWPRGAEDWPRVIVIEPSSGLRELGKLVDAVKEVRQETDADVLVLGKEPTAEDMLRVLHAGAYEYLSLSAVRKDPEAFCELIRRICVEREMAPEDVKSIYQTDVGLFLGRSPKILAAVSEAARALSEDAVLIEGESGAGKSFLAKVVIEGLFPKRAAAFVRVDCGALSESLRESELFGWLGQSFTGSGGRDRPGLFERAHEGVLFLDEIGNLAPPHQRTLLLALESNPENPFLKTFRKIGGGGEDVTVNVQVVAATAYNLQEMVARREFSEPLYFRISRYCVTVPPLRQRQEDIPYLARRLLCAESVRMKKRFVDIAGDALELLQRYPWPGNVRELSNVISATVRMHRGTVLEADQLPAHIRRGAETPSGQALYGKGLIRLKTGLSPEELTRLADEFHKGEARMPDGSVVGFADAAPEEVRSGRKFAERLRIGRTTLHGRLREQRK